MCSDIDKWLRSSLPKLDIEKVPLQKSIGRRLQAHRRSCARRSGNGKRPLHGPFTDLNEPSILGQKQQAAWKKFGNLVFGPASNLAVVHEIILGGVVLICLRDR